MMVMPVLFTDDYRKATCKIGQGYDCCRYLVCGAQGFECAKSTTMQWTLDDKVKNEDMTARGDNCEGIFTPQPAYRLLKSHWGLAEGDIVYSARVYDYGCSSDDSRITGRPHSTMTSNPAGWYPTFSVPDEDMERVTTKTGE